MKYLMLFILLLFSGCGETDYLPNVGSGQQPAMTVQSSSNFILEKVQRFRDTDAYGDVRAVYILKDSKTGKEYIGVSGIGISERGNHTSGKSSVQDER